MKTTDLTPIVEQAIREKRNIEIDYEHIDGQDRRVRTVAPFDIGIVDPVIGERFKDNLYAYSADHMNHETEEAEPQMLVFAIGHIFSGKLLDTTFDPVECRRTSLQHDPVDWGDKEFRLVPDRAWFGVSNTS